MYTTVHMYLQIHWHTCCDVANAVGEVIPVDVADTGARNPLNAATTLPDLTGQHRHRQNYSSFLQN